MESSAFLSDVVITEVEGQDRLLAQASVLYMGALRLNEIRILRGDKRPLVYLPSRKVQKGAKSEYFPFYEFRDRGFQKQVEDFVRQAYVAQQKQKAAAAKSGERQSYTEVVKAAQDKAKAAVEAKAVSGAKS